MPEMANLSVEISPGGEITQIELDLIRQIIRRHPGKTVFTQGDFIEQRTINIIADWLTRRDGYVVLNEATLSPRREEVEHDLLDRLRRAGLWG